MFGDTFVFQCSVFISSGVEPCHSIIESLMYHYDTIGLMDSRIFQQVLCPDFELKDIRSIRGFIENGSYSRIEAFLPVYISWHISGAWLWTVSWLRAAGAGGGVSSSNSGPRAETHRNNPTGRLVYFLNSP